jgi:WD40 repeat protein
LVELHLKNPLNGIELTHSFFDYQEFGGSNPAFSADGNFFANFKQNNYRDLLAIIYDLRSGKEIRSIKQPDYNTNALALSPDGHYLAVGGGSSGNGRVHLFDLANGQEIQTFQLKTTVEMLRFSPDGHYLAVGQRDYSMGNISILDMTSFKEILTHPIRYIFDLAFSPDGKYLAVGQSSYGEDGALLLDLTNGKVAFSLSEAPAQAVAFSPYGSRLAIASNNNGRNVRLYEIASKTLLMTFKCNSPIHSLAFSPDGHYLATGEGNGENGQVSVFDAIDYSFLRSYFNPRIINGVAFSPDGRYIAANGTLYRTLFAADSALASSVTLPPNLTASINFIDPSGNKTLDALEKGKFQLSITNNGKGPAKGLVVKITPETIENLYYTGSFIEEIPPGKTATIDIPIEAYLNVGDGNHTLRFSIEEANSLVL